jgi:hypothetical protein
MSYTKQVWANGSEGGTPIDAPSLDHIEQGIFDAVAVEQLLLNLVADTDLSSGDTYPALAVVTNTIMGASLALDGVVITLPAGVYDITCWFKINGISGAQDLVLMLGSSGSFIPLAAEILCSIPVTAMVATYLIDNRSVIGVVTPACSVALEVALTGGAGSLTSDIFALLFTKRD